MELGELTIWKLTSMFVLFQFSWQLWPQSGNLEEEGWEGQIVIPLFTLRSPLLLKEPQ